MDEDREVQKQRLLQMIDEEEKLIRIYEADLKLTRKRRRPSCYSNSSYNSINNKTTPSFQSEQDSSESDDLLSTLNALQSSHDDGTITLDTRWQDDPRLYRILPHVGGIAFCTATHVGGAVDSLNNNNYCHQFSFQGRVCASDATKVGFSVSLQVTTTTTTTVENMAKVSSLSLEFDEKDYKNDNNGELQDIIQLSQECCNPPLMFRQILNWAKFDRQREMVIQELLQEYEQLEKIDTTRIRVRWSETSSLEICWKWTVNWATSGKDELTMKVCHVDAHSVAAQALMESNGLQNVAESAGSREEALRLVLRVAAVKKKSS